MREDETKEAAQSGRIDARAGFPVDPAFVTDPDDTTAEATAYLLAYSAERRRIETQQTGALAAAE